MIATWNLSRETGRTSSSIYSYQGKIHSWDTKWNFNRLFPCVSSLYTLLCILECQFSQTQTSLKNGIMHFSQAWTFGIAEWKEYHWNASKKCMNSCTLCKEIRQPLSTPVKYQNISFRFTVQAWQPKNLNYAVLQSLLSCSFWHFAQSRWIRVRTCEELCWNCRNKGICWNPIPQIICSPPYLRGHVPDANTSSCKQLGTVSSCWGHAVVDFVALIVIWLPEVAHFWQR